MPNEINKLIHNPSEQKIISFAISEEAVSHKLNFSSKKALFKFPSLNFTTNMTRINLAPFHLISNTSIFLSMDRIFNCFKICFKVPNQSISR